MMGESEIEVKKKHIWVAVVIVLIVSGFFAYSYYSNKKEVWDSIEKYDTEIKECTLNIKSASETYDLEETQENMGECIEKVNKALSDIDKWNKKDPENRNYEAMKLSYEAGKEALEAYDLILNIKEDSLERAERIRRSEEALDLINSALEKHEEFRNQFSDTRYYEKYYEKEEGKESIEKLEDLRNDLKSQISEAKNCPSGYVLGNDYVCYEECGSSGEYCRTGECYNGECVSCPEGYILGNDGKCHEPCGNLNKYCKGDSKCFNGNCVSCPDDYYLGTDGRCYEK